jgi:hypothetical protein
MTTNTTPAHILLASLTEGAAVTLTVSATVFDLPDSEDDPGEGHYTFAFEFNGERELVSLTEGQVLAMVRPS